jgi:hypothetical protein
MRRKALRDWTPLDVVSDVEAAFFGDADQRTVRAAAVMRYTYGRMKKSDIAEWEAEAAAESPPGTLKSHAVFMFDFDDVDHIALYMDNESTVLIRAMQPVDGSDEGRTLALGWVGEPHTETDITHIPGVYQAAMIEFVTGVQRLWNQETLAWWLPGSDGPGLVYRKYPPRTDEAKPEFMLMAMTPDMRAGLYNQFLRSPTVDEEMKRGIGRRWRRR